MRSIAETHLRRGLWAISGASVASVAVALVAQHGFDMQPCPWCILQRLLFVLIGIGAGLAALLPRSAARVGAALLVVLAVAGFAAAVYQNQIAAKSASCNLSLAEQLLMSLKLDGWAPGVFEIRASCADAATRLLGMPFELWSAALFALIAGLSAWLVVRAAR